MAHDPMCMWVIPSSAWRNVLSSALMWSIARGVSIAAPTGQGPTSRRVRMPRRLDVWDVRPYPAEREPVMMKWIMVNDAMQLTVIGAGAWGTTLAALASEHVATTLWAREQAVADTIRDVHENTAFLPGFSLPSQLSVSVDLAASLAGADVVFVAVPSPYLRRVMVESCPSLDPHTLVVSVTKGLEAGTGNRMTEVITDTLVGHDPATVGLLAGPNLAREVMAGHPSATCVAFAQLRYATDVQRLLMSERLRLYTSSDVVGCEISGAVKNVIAVAAGMADGLGYGMNTKAALTTRGLAELARLGTAMGGDPLTFLGLAGAGDLMATCASPLSRNRRVGEQITRGGVLADLRSGTPSCAEGVSSVGAVLTLAARHDVDMPSCATVAAVLAGDTTPGDAVARLMGREATVELHDISRRT
jgi:glycerol-3-phosphate dehydrogenase (NAD(P)+)